MAMTIRIPITRMIEFFSRMACFCQIDIVFVPALFRRRQHDAGRLDGFRRIHRFPKVPHHDQRADEEQQTAERADDVERMHRLHRLDERIFEEAERSVGAPHHAYTSLGFLEYSFVETVEAMHPFYVIRALGGLLFLIGALVMVWNLWKTVNSAEAAETAGQVLAPAE